LELHDGNGAVFVFNDNWQDAQKAAIQADKLAPINAKESAIEATPAPGSYTAVLRGKNNGTGVGLVEAYNLHLLGSSEADGAATGRRPRTAIRQPNECAVFSSVSTSMSRTAGPAGRPDDNRFAGDCDQMP
jgi:hypothetical protein